MKKIYITLLIFLSQIVVNNNVSAQSKYFPHSVGNTWQYMYNDGRFEQIKIHRDSVDTNGNVFLNLGETTFPDFYWSYKVNNSKDTITYLPFTLVWILYKFPSDSGDIFPLDANGYYGKIYDIQEIQLFGKKTTNIEFRYYNGHPDSFGSGWMFTNILVNNYGLSWYGNEVEYKTLIGCIIDGDTSGIIFTDIKDELEVQLPKNVKLNQNYPNPFNPTTTISYQLPQTSFVQLKVYDILGEEITTLVKEIKPEGIFSINFDASSLPSGVYIYSLHSNGFVQNRKMTLIK